MPVETAPSPAQNSPMSNRSKLILVIVLVAVCAAVAIGVAVSQSSLSSSSSDNLPVVIDCDTSPCNYADTSSSPSTTTTTTTATKEIAYTAEWDSWKGWPDIPYRWGPKVGGMDVDSTRACQNHCKTVQAEYGVYWRNGRHAPNCDCYLYLSQLGCPLIPEWYSGGTFFAVRDPACFRPPE